MKNAFTIRLKRLTLCAVLFARVLSPCLAQTVRPLDLGQHGWLTDSMMRQQALRYQVLSAKDDIKLHWTGKTFRPPKGCEGDRHLVTSSLEKVDSKLFTHPLSITIKDIEVSKNDGKQEPMTILAVKSADKGWKISLSHTGWFMLKEYIGLAIGTTFLVDNCIYIIIFTAMWKTDWNGLSAEIYRKALYHDVVKPFIGKLLPQ